MTAGRRPVVLLAVPDADRADYARHLPEACAALGFGIDLRGVSPPGEVDYIVHNPRGGLGDFAPFARLRAVFSLWAGVEHVVANPTLTVPLTRMADAGLIGGMRDYVAGHVLRYHLDIDAHLAGQDGAWRKELLPPLARERTVVFLGQGALGRAAAEAVAGLGFRTMGWSRGPKPPHPAIEDAHGEDGLARVLPRAEILVLLLPATPATADILDARRLALLPRGARIVNPARGTLIDEAALLAALDAGHVAHATLDVFRAEPLAAGHPFWSHPRITVTPHIAAETRPATAAALVAENLRRAEAGEPLLHRVDRGLGY